MHLFFCGRGPSFVREPRRFRVQGLLQFGHTQLNYSELMGGVSAAAISTYTYHPQSERSFGNVMSVWGTQMAWDAATYMIKEFWPDLRKKRKSSH